MKNELTWKGYLKRKSGNNTWKRNLKGNMEKEPGKGIWEGNLEIKP